jgi:hypothetical protein
MARRYQRFAARCLEEARAGLKERRWWRTKVAVQCHWKCRQPLSKQTLWRRHPCCVGGLRGCSTQAQQSIVVDPKSPGSINSLHGLILYDGVCVLCSRGCGFVSKHDRRAYFRIVPMQLAKGRDWFRALVSEHTSATVSNIAQIPDRQKRRAKNNRNAIPKRSAFSSS